MSFYPQPNDWTCGPFALKHALAALGRVVDENELILLARSHWWSGTDELRLSRAADAFDCDLPVIRRLDPQKAKSELVAHLRKLIPVILCVDDWAHWITVVRYEGTRFVVLDSNMDPVLGVLTWPQLQKRWRSLDWEYDDEDPPALYDLMPVIPRSRVAIKADFRVARVRYLRRPENRSLAQHWNDYLEDLLEICRPPSARMIEPLSMAELLRRNQELILGRVLYWHGDVERKLLAKLLHNYRFVAETYGLVVPRASSRRAVTDLAVLTTMWAVANGGIGPMYGTGEV